MWNGADPILKERLFGLTNSEGNHGEDVKEYYFYLDSTPTHSYLKYLYKYPQRAFPYDDLVQTNRARRRDELEYELLDTGVFAEDRYFDVFVEYAKAAPEDILMQITVCNRGPEPAQLHVLPTFWFRNTWAAPHGDDRPSLLQLSDGASIVAADTELGERFIYCEEPTELLFTENETNTRRIANTPNATPYVKDGINDYIVRSRREAVNPQRCGTKAAAHYLIEVAAGQSKVLRVRLSDRAQASPFGNAFESVIAARRRESDEFYAGVIPASVSADAANVMRQALAGMLWSKQFYFYDIGTWLQQRNGGSPRNRHWRHLRNADAGR